MACLETERAAWTGSFPEVAEPEPGAKLGFNG